MKKKLQIIAMLIVMLCGTTAMAQNKQQVDKFSIIEIEGALDVKLVKGSEYSVVLEGDEDAVARVATYVNGRTLHVELKNKDRWRNWSGDKVEVTITYDIELVALRMSGASKVEADHTIEGTTFELNTSGASTVTLNINMERLDSTIEGASTINLSGKSLIHWARIQGASNYKTADLEANKVEVDIQGASQAKVWAMQEIQAVASGASTLRYKGEPGKTDVDSSGASTIKKM